MTTEPDLLTVGFQVHQAARAAQEAAAALETLAILGYRTYNLAEAAVGARFPDSEGEDDTMREICREGIGMNKLADAFDDLMDILAPAACDASRSSGAEWLAKEEVRPEWERSRAEIEAERAEGAAR